LGFRSDFVQFLVTNQFTLTLIDTEDSQKQFSSTTLIAYLLQFYLIPLLANIDADCESISFSDEDNAASERQKI
jgi:hypothetical protein